MDVWEAGDQGDNDKVDPWRRLFSECVQRDEERECPELQKDRSPDAAVDDLAEVTENEEREQADHFGRDTE